MHFTASLLTPADLKVLHICTPITILQFINFPQNFFFLHFGNDVNRRELTDDDDDNQVKELLFMISFWLGRRGKRFFNKECPTLQKCEQKNKTS